MFGGCRLGVVVCRMTSFIALVWFGVCDLCNAWLGFGLVLGGLGLICCFG